MYFIHPESIRDGLRKGYLKTKHPYKAGPFVMLPINTQPKIIKNLNLDTLPGKDKLEKNHNKLSEDKIKEFENAINKFNKIVIKAGGGSRNFLRNLRDFQKF